MNAQPNIRLPRYVPQVGKLKKSICKFVHKSPECKHMLCLKMDKESSCQNKVHHDPGWNDPPLFSYDSMSAAGQPSTNKKANLLNKRVAYPMGQQKVVSGGMNPTLPPTNSAVPPPPCSATFAREAEAKSLPQAKDEELLDKEEALSRVKEGFQEILEKNANFLQGAEEINKRLSTMFKMWEEDRFDSSIQRRLLELVEALKANDYGRADHLHVGLAVDHACLCASWIPVVRRIVQQLKSNQQNDSEKCISEPLSQSSDQDGSSALKTD